MLKNLTIVSDFLKKHQKHIAFSRNKFIATAQLTLLEEECTKAGIGFEKENDVLEFKLKSFLSPNLVYFDQLNFLEPDFLFTHFCILKFNGDYCYYSQENQELQFNPSASGDFRMICSNAYYYNKLYLFFTSKNFADHHNDADKEIVVYSSAKGIFKITYELNYTVQYSDFISDPVQALIRTASPLEVRSFFRNALFAFSNGTGTISIDNIIKKSRDIIEATQRDYDLVSKQFDFEKFRNALYKEKGKYFTNIREIVNKIFSQAVGIPISISATVFATYKISDDRLLLVLVFLAFLIYIFFYIKIQLVYKEDIRQLKEDFEIDFDEINLKSGLPFHLIIKEKEKVNRKITSSMKMINFLIGTISFLGLLVGFYIIYELKGVKS